MLCSHAVKGRLGLGTAFVFGPENAFLRRPLRLLVGEGGQGLLVLIMAILWVGFVMLLSSF